jgi:hypothetical protein
LLLVSVHECVDYRRHVETLEVGVLLAHSHKQDRFTCCLDHVDAGADLLVHGVKLRQHDAVDRPRVGLVDSEVNQALIKLRQLVD